LAKGLYTLQNWCSLMKSTCLCFLADNLKAQATCTLVWIRNDRHSNEPLLQSTQGLGRFVAQFNQHPRSVTGVLRQPTDRVRSLTADAYPGMNGQSLQVLWAREFPTQDSINIQWSICAASFVAAAVCAVAYKRQRRNKEDPPRFAEQGPI
jgi:hypothetical protein